MVFTSPPVFLSQDLSEIFIRLQRKNKIKIEGQEPDWNLKTVTSQAVLFNSQIGIRSSVVWRCSGDAAAEGERDLFRSERIQVFSVFRRAPKWETLRPGKLTDWVRRLCVEGHVIMGLMLIMLIACCLFCSLLLLPVQNDSDRTENTYQPCCSWRLVMGYDCLLCNTARQGGSFSVVLILQRFLSRKEIFLLRKGSRSPPWADRQEEKVGLFSQHRHRWVSSLFFHSLTLWEVHSAQAACCLTRILGACPGQGQMIPSTWQNPFFLSLCTASAVR